MLTAIFAVAFLASAAVLAVWIDMRFPRSRPADLKGALPHLFVASLANQALDSPLSGRIAGSSLPYARLAALGLILPLLVYAALAALWTIRSAQRAIGHLRR